MSSLSRWPLLVAASLMLGAAVALDISAGPSTDYRAVTLAFILTLLAAVCLGAFVYAEGTRWRERIEASRQPNDDG